MFLSSHNTKKRNGLKNKKDYKPVEILYLDRSGCLTGFLPIDTTVTTNPQEMTTQFILVLCSFTVNLHYYFQVIQWNVMSVKIRMIILENALKP